MREHAVVNAVREKRLEAGLTQADLAERVGLARQSIISIEKGRFLPTIENALRIARVFGTKTDQLFWLAEEDT